MDARHAYEPADAARTQARVHLTVQKSNGQWRIDELPQGVVHGQVGLPAQLHVRQQVLLRLERAVGSPVGSPRPSPIRSTCRTQVDPMTQTVRALLGGPTRWLGPVVRSASPPVRS